MNKKRIILFMNVFLCIMLIVSAAILLSACENEKGNENDTQNETESQESETNAITSEAEADNIIKDGVAQYTVVRCYDGNISSTEISYAQKLYTGIKSLTGVDFDFKDDFVASWQTPDSTTKEILVGTALNSPEAKEVLSELKYKDYAIVKRGNKLIITSPSESGLLKAINYFLNVVVPTMIKDEKDEMVNLAVPEDFIFRAEYNVEQMKINGVDLSEYRIVYSTANHKMFQESAVEWQQNIANAYGHILEIASDQDESTDYEILIGNTSRTESSTAYADTSIMDMLLKYDIKVSGKKILIISGGAYSAARASYEFANKALNQKEVSIDNSYILSGTLINAERVPLTDGADVRIMSANILAQFPTWSGTPVAPRAEIFAANLYFYMPDVIGVQEVSSDWVKYLPYYLGDTFKLFGTVQPGGGSNYSALIYNMIKYDIEAEGFKQYSYQANPACRNMKWAIFKDKTTSQRFGMLSTHWDFGMENEKIAMRKVQLTEHSALVAELVSTYSCPIMTTGDYNCNEASDSYAEFMAINNMQDAKFAAARRYNVFGSTHALGSSAISTNSIDCVFATLDTTVLGYMTLVDNETIMLSDHCLIFADIKLNTTEGK